MSTTKRRAIQILHNNTFQFTFKCGYNDFISKYTDTNSLHVTQIDLLHNDTFCSTQFTRFRRKKGSLRVNSVMILVVLSTHAELASATARGRSYWETGELITLLLCHSGRSQTVEFDSTWEWCCSAMSPSWQCLGALGLWNCKWHLQNKVVKHYAAG